MSALLYMFDKCFAVLNTSSKILIVTHEHSARLDMHELIGLENKKVVRETSQLLFLLDQRQYSMKTAIQWLVLSTVYVSHNSLEDVVDEKSHLTDEKSTVVENFATLWT